MPRINSGSAIDTTIVGAGTAPYYVSEIDANRSVLTPLLADETAKTEQAQLFHLITIDLPDETTPQLMLVDSNYDVKFNNIVYSKFPIKYSGVSVSSDGTIDKASIAIANVSREIMYYVEKYDGLKNQRIRIKSVYKNALDQIYEMDYVTNSFPSTDDAPVNPTGNPAAYTEDEYLIDNYSANEQIVSFALEPIADLQIKLPRRRYLVDSCYWKYKDARTCKYSGELATCALTFAACRAHGNEENFGGFPGISGTRKIYL